MTLPAVDPAQAVQAGVYQLLRDDATLMAVLAGDGVYDEPPEGAGYPYVVNRDYLSIDDSTHSTVGRQLTGTLHTWTKARGNAPGNLIGGHLVRLLHQQNAALDALVVGHTVYIVRHEFHQSLPDPNRTIRHRIDRFRIYTSQESP